MNQAYRLLRTERQILSWRSSRGLALFAMVLAMPSILIAQTPLKSVQAVTSTGSSDTAIVDFVLPQPDQVTTVEVVANGTHLEADKVKFSSPEKLKDYQCAVLLLIDRTLGNKEPNERTKEKLSKAVRDTLTKFSLSAETAPFQFGVATISAGNLEVLSAMPSKKSFVESAIAKLRLDGVSPDLYLGTKRAIDYLSGVRADRKFVILLSSGVSNDKAVFQEQVVLAAKAARVHICTIGFPASDAKDDVQRLVPLSDETAGYSVRADGTEFTLPRESESNLIKYMGSGGRAEVNTAGLKTPINLEFNIKTAFDKTYTFTHKIDADAPESTLSPTPQPTPKPSAVAFIREQIIQHPLLTGFAAAALVIALGLMLILRARSKAQQRSYDDPPLTPEQNEPAEPLVPTDDEPTNVVTPLPPVLAWLVSLDGDQTRHPIRKTAVRIGRKSDNDIVLKNDSVSNYHAEVLKRGERFLIADLDSSNKVFVNDKRVEKTQLENGDVIELGEVRFRFILSETSNGG